MANTDPEALGQKLAETVDREALLDEAGAETKAAMLPEIRRAFDVQFSENQEHVQHELLDTAFHDELSARYTDPENMTKEGLVTAARDDARYCLSEYADVLAGDRFTVQLADVSKDDVPAFNDAVVDGYWQDTATELIEQYTN
jgi:hypothetical protein